MDPQYYVEEEPSIEKKPFQFSSHIQQKTGAGTMAGAHIHDYIEILYAVSGSFEILLNNRDYCFREGDLILINSGEIHHILALSDGLNEYYVIKFKPDMLYTTSQSLFEIQYVMPFVLNESSHQKIFKREEIENSIVPGTIKDLHREYTTQNYGYELAIRANIFSLFLFILRSWNARNVDLNINPDISPDIVNRLNKVMDYVNNHCQEEITAQAMSGLCSLSYSYFSRLFKRIMRKNFKDYLNYVRISKAEELLSTTDMNVTEIALAAGFTTSSYFIRQFKAYKGITPKQFHSRYIKRRSPIPAKERIRES